jgi:transcriptional regulator with GAF, ATPase, and Fis domain
MPDAGEQLESLAASLARARGEDFFPSLVQHLVRVLDAREVLIGEAAHGRRVRTLAAWRDGAPVASHEYALEGTPCAEVYAGKTLLIENRRESPVSSAPRGAYFGTPLTAKDGAVLGHLCAWLNGPAQMDASQRAVCAVLADRAAAELRLVHVKRERALLRAQKQQLRTEIDSLHDVDALVGVSAAHARISEEMRRVAPAGAAVLITGEPGTGKELVARAIHRMSPRAARPFTKLDCAALAAEAQIAMLPQICAFTNGGTLFLDEIGALPAELQARLLAALPATHDERRDSGAPDVRVIASTNRDLRKAMQQRAFREDLYFRLNVFPIEIPPLRTRVEDIAPIVQYLARRLALRLGRQVDGIDPNSLAELARHSWPGNMRELATLVERSMVTQGGPLLKLSADLFATASPAERAALIAAAAVDTASTTRTTFTGMDFDDTLNTGLHAVQREHILRVLNATHWVIEGNSGAALKLGMKPATLRHRMKKLGISRAQNQH